MVPCWRRVVLLVLLGMSCRMNRVDGEMGILLCGARETSFLDLHFKLEEEALRREGKLQSSTHRRDMDAAADWLASVLYSSFPLNSEPSPGGLDAKCPC
jgi:hypothetical protein